MERCKIAIENHGYENKSPFGLRKKVAWCNKAQRFILTEREPLFHFVTLILTSLNVQTCEITVTLKVNPISLF